MLASSIPTKIVLPFANNAGGSYINVVPVGSQIGITNGAASFYDGFPPNCFIALAAGGAGPFGKDFNGLLNVMSAWNRWACAGATVQYDSTFQADADVGGYPQGALVASATVLGTFWLSTVDNNTTNPDTGGSGWINFLALGGIQTGGYLSFGSATQITLSPVCGGMLWINGINQPIPGAGVNLSSSGLSASTSYFVYAFMNSGTMTLEASTTGYTKNANGIPQKSGDATRTLVGGGGTNASSQFTFLGTSSYFNRKNKNGLASTSSLTVTPGNVLVEISPTLLRIIAWFWSDDAPIGQTDGCFQNSGASAVTVQSAVDGSLTGTFQQQSTTSSNSIGGFNSSLSNSPLTDGLHTVSPFNSCDTGSFIYEQIYNWLVVRG